MASVESTAPEVQSSEREICASSPNDIERRIAALFGEVLGLAQVATDQSFFDLGGNSLLGMRVLSTLGQELQLHVPLPLLLEARTVAALAQAVAALSAGRVSSV